MTRQRLFIWVVALGFTIAATYAILTLAMFAMGYTLDVR